MVSLDNNERAVLLAYNEEDPQAEQWITPWATGLDLKKHGADLMADSQAGRMSVARRLATRKLLEGEPGVRGTWRGYAITAKGREAIK